MTWNVAYAYDNEDRGRGNFSIPKDIVDTETFIRQMIEARSIVERRQAEDQMIAFFNQNVDDPRWKRIVGGGTLM